METDLLNKIENEISAMRKDIDLLKKILDQLAIDEEKRGFSIEEIRDTLRRLFRKLS